MTQLTKEHFDSELKTLVTKSELSARLTDQTRQLKDYTDTQLSTLHQELQEGFAGMDQKLDALRELLDVRQRVEHLEEQMRQVQAQK